MHAMYYGCQFCFVCFFSALHFIDPFSQCCLRTWTAVIFWCWYVYLGTCVAAVSVFPETLWVWICPYFDHSVWQLIPKEICPNFCPPLDHHHYEEKIIPITFWLKRYSQLPYFSLFKKWDLPSKISKLFL